MNYVNQLYNKYFDISKKNYDLNETDLNERDKKSFDPNQFIMLSKKKKTERIEEKTKKEMQKPLWFKINKKEFEELTKDIYNNQDNNNFETITNKKNL